jgi:hypothetical protein
MSDASKPPEGQTARIAEVRQRPLTDDPALSGRREHNWTLAVPPEMPSRPPRDDRDDPDGPDDRDTGAFELLPRVQFAPAVEAQLSPGATREVELQISNPSVLMATVRWIGTTSPLDVSLLLDGTILATGTNQSRSDNKGQSTLNVRTTGGGRATVTVTNTSGATVNVKIVLGALDSSHETR